MKSNLLSFVFMFVFALSAVSALSLDVVNLTTGEDNVSFVLENDTVLDVINGTINGSGIVFEFNTTYVNLSGLNYGWYSINVTANATDGSNDSIVKYFEIEKLVTSEKANDYEDYFNYKFVNKSIFSEFNVTLFDEDDTILNSSNESLGSFVYPKPENYTLQVNLTTVNGVNQVVNFTKELKPFEAEVKEITFDGTVIDVLALPNYFCANTTLEIFNATGALVYNTTKDSCGDASTETVGNDLYNDIDLGSEGVYTLVYNATSKVHNVFRTQTESFSIYPSALTNRTNETLVVDVNFAYWNPALYPTIYLSISEDGSTWKTMTNMTSATFYDVDKHSNYTVDFIFFTPSGLIVREALDSIGEPKETDNGNTGGNTGGNTNNNDNTGGNTGGTNEVCEAWSVCINGTQTQSCNDGNVIKTRTCVDENGTIILDDNVNVPAETNETNEGFFAPITGAVVGAFTGEDSEYWVAGLIIALLIALWVVILKKGAAPKGEKVTPVKKEKAKKKASKKK